MKSSYSIERETLLFSFFRALCVQFKKNSCGWKYKGKYSFLFHKGIFVFSLVRSLVVELKWIFVLSVEGNSRISLEIDIGMLC